jgi:predicted nucleic acid-binding protein
MRQTPLRVYADTSVLGGVFDDEFAEPSGRFIQQVREGRFRLVTSAAVLDELSRAPSPVRELFDETAALVEVVEESEAAVDLQAGYLRAGIVPEKRATDALHVALASVAGCAALVSWNFRHIVHFQKVPLYNAVNAIHGYAPLAICAPPEVVQYDQEEEGI